MPKLRRNGSIVFLLHKLFHLIPSLVTNASISPTDGIETHYIRKRLHDAAVICLVYCVVCSGNGKHGENICGCAILVTRRGSNHVLSSSGQNLMMTESQFGMRIMPRIADGLHSFLDKPLEKS